jgi:hypothetical protein
MPISSYVKDCEKMLSQFEKTQSKMLKLNLESAGADFSIQLREMRQFFREILKDLREYTFSTERDKTLLTKQIERLLIFLKEMDLHINGFQAKLSPNENEIIFIFERQHLFKNIYRKHLTDYSAIFNK